MSDYVSAGSLQVEKTLHHFIEQEVLPHHDSLSSEDFWQNFAKLVAQFVPENQALLDKRDALQKQLDQWHSDNPGPIQDMAAYEAFLRKIGYLVDEPAAFQIRTEQVDREIAEQAGPQLVVPITNARYALNAANARWGSLYDALYGTDAINQPGVPEPSSKYDSVRGDAVIAFARDFLDQSIPLTTGSHKDATKYQVIDGRLAVTLEDGSTSQLKQADLFVGYNGDADQPNSLLFLHNGLHFDILLDRNDAIGKQDKAGIKDIIMEAALTTIMDFEDSVAAVDGEDKTLAYRNWLGLMDGSLTENVVKGDTSFIRRMNPDREYTHVDGASTFKLGGRSLMFIRNVGHLMTTPAILDAQGNEIPEGILDAVMTAMIAPVDLKRQENKNSRAGSVYIVKPKMHGPEEVAFANRLFAAAEALAGLSAHTLKMGVMDEERRTTINLRACIKEAADRLVFINTGFLDRTGDEIHTSMSGGAMIRKGDMKNSKWLQAYERNNVQAGLDCGLPGKAQIGKGMWAMPDRMADMLREKIAHPRSGATTAWVPSPTGATLHALHYHQVNVFEVQEALKKEAAVNVLADILTVPVAASPSWTQEEIKEELDNNCQGLLGYVVRWVESGVGCSKVPDIHNVGLMEDRATLRISSQHICNWLAHGITNEAQVRETLQRMAKVVDEQNAGDPNYVPMTGREEDSPAFQAACDLIFKGKEQPSGYTEPLLHHWRKVAKKH